ncbi:hypothetical protein KBY66_00740 [Synechococcus sp. Tobar12-5m-g]|uniref:hypothetical protein n=1 Tax=Synechococcus sp. Cruz CV-v-12 TaxID=2823728 RepID=UPI0020CB946C|nr:hypothetical protein [Synechococcus sp. Cruz CV-v-12]MCP9771162.1 hypothetical protein [Synechococcus sp. Tobar12-5m-g]MCP9872102.1 hypothetical protein [Synechococcus sp. Cruz CV-v-12]
MIVAIGAAKLPTVDSNAGSERLLLAVASVRCSGLPVMPFRRKTAMTSSLLNELGWLLAHKYTNLLAKPRKKVCDWHVEVLLDRSDIANQTAKM